MWIILEGEVRVERGGPGTDKPRENLGKLRALGLFGELAVRPANIVMPPHRQWLRVFVYSSPID